METTTFLQGPFSCDCFVTLGSKFICSTILIPNQSLPIGHVLYAVYSSPYMNAQVNRTEFLPWGIYSL